MRFDVRRTIIIIYLVSLLFGPGGAWAQANKMLIIKSQDLQSYNDAIAGLNEHLSTASAFGSKALDIQQLDLETQAGTVSSIKQNPPALIAAVGTKAAKWALSNFSQTPTVFLLVFDPKQNKILPGNQPTETMTGVTADVPVKYQLTYAQRILANRKRIGILYDPKFSTNLLAEINAEKASTGVEIVAKAVTSGQEVPMALKELEGKVDAFWLLPDPTLIEKSARQQIMLFWVKLKVPIIGIAPTYVKAGAAYCLSVNSFEAGKQAGQMCLKIAEGTNPAQISVESPKNYTVVYNKEVLSQLGISLPEDILKIADAIQN